MAAAEYGKTVDIRVAQGLSLVTTHNEGPEMTKKKKKN